MSGFGNYVITTLSLSVIASIFTYRVINAFLEYLLLPCVNIAIDPNEKMSSLNFKFTTGKDNRKKEFSINPDADIPTPSYNIFLGAFIKELLIWFIFMGILYVCNKKIAKINDPKITGKNTK